ncbi:hypothetical protein ACHQM5_015547 [Ranunculus cassubicifolius]
MFQRKHSHDQPQNSEQEVEKVKKLKASIGPVSGRSLQYCTDASLRRYLRARNWNVDHAKSISNANVYKGECVCHAIFIDILHKKTLQCKCET